MIGEVIEHCRSKMWRFSWEFLPLRHWSPLNQRRMLSITNHSRRNKTLRTNLCVLYEFTQKIQITTFEGFNPGKTQGSEDPRRFASLINWAPVLKSRSLNTLCPQQHFSNVCLTCHIQSFLTIPCKIELMGHDSTPSLDVTVEKDLLKLIYLLKIRID